jgi:hypothetical protein
MMFDYLNLLFYFIIATLFAFAFSGAAFFFAF